jgi:hypothetical protein
MPIIISISFITVNAEALLHMRHRVDPLPRILFMPISSRELMFVSVCFVFNADNSTRFLPFTGYDWCQLNTFQRG